MAWTITASEMIAELRRRGGYRRSTALTDTILTGFLNAGIAEVHDLLTKHNPDFLVTSADLATTIGTATVSLPTTFYKSRRVDYMDGTTPIRLRPYQMDEETYLDSDTVWTTDSGIARPRYMLQAGTIRLVPTPASVYTLRLWYIPHATRLLAEATAELDLSDVTVRVDTVIQAAESGEDGNDITIAFVADGAGAGTLNEGAFPVLVFHYQSGVTTVANFETAVDASTNLEVKTAGTAANVITATGDTFSATGLAGGVTETVYDGVNGHEDLVYEHALRRCKIRDRVSTVEHDAEIQRLEKRLMWAMEDRDQSEPDYLPDLGREECY